MSQSYRNKNLWKNVYKVWPFGIERLDTRGLKYYMTICKVKVTLEQAMKAQRGSGGIAVLFL